MVSFVCNHCQETLKKPKLEAHTKRCPRFFFTCIDCNTDFPGRSFVSHNSCISEAEKYAGKAKIPTSNGAKLTNKLNEPPAKRNDLPIPKGDSKKRKQDESAKTEEKKKKKTGIDQGKIALKLVEEIIQQQKKPMKLKELQEELDRRLNQANPSASVKKELLKVTPY